METKIKMCIECKERPVENKKRGLCNRCYQRLRDSGSILGHEPFEDLSMPTRAKIAHAREIEFIKNYFSHPNWVYRPALFRTDRFKYSPDFYDGERNVFIEVAGTRQAYSANKEKYDAFRAAYPKLNFEIRKSDGTLLNENSRDKNWPKQ